MYSMVMVLSMTGAPEVPQFGWNKHGCNGGCYGGHATVVTTHSGGCYGNGGGCYGNGHGLFGGKLMGCFSCFKHKSNGCTGGYGCTGYSAGHGTIVTTPADTGCGTVVIPPTTGVAPAAPPATVPPTTAPPMKTAPPATVPPKPEPPKGTPKIG
jgi:hypothetical protein